VFRPADSSGESALAFQRQTGFLAAVDFSHLRHETGQKIRILVFVEGIKTELMEDVVVAGLA
jgi:hypothetical protein